VLVGTKGNAEKRAKHRDSAPSHWLIVVQKRRCSREMKTCKKYQDLKRADNRQVTWRCTLQSESLSGKCAKLHTVAASYNRDHRL